MHILLTILGILGAAAFWWYRVKYIGEAANEVIDGAQKMRGAYRRRKFRNKSEGSVVTAIEDPVTAAAAMMVSVAQLEGPLSAASENLIKKHITSIASDHDVEEEFVFAKWVCEKTIDPNNISMKMSKIWNSALNHSERLGLIDMVRQVACADKEPSAIQLEAIDRLTERLNISQTYIQDRLYASILR